MSVNFEVKGTLAKLLATEDLIVEHKNVSTASFNVSSRVLTLPRWEKASNNVMNLLIAHEVGHALFTPNEDWRKKTDIPQGFINVTEDVRIENLMKQKFGGLPKTFYKGYHELHDKDFFEISTLDVSTMNIADRANLYFKVGNFVQVTFTDEEKVVIDQCAAARTFDDAIAAAEALYALHEQQKEEQEKQKSEEDSSTSEEPQEVSGDDQDEEQVEQEQSEGETGETGEGGDSMGSDSQRNGGEETEPSEDDYNEGGESAGELTDDVSTMDSLSDNLEDLASKSGFNEPEYIEYPTINTKDFIAKNEDIHQYLQVSWAKQREYMTEHFEQAEDYIDRGFGVHERAYHSFKREVQSEVNYMVKEFECKKSAAAYARATVSKTGVLDCTKLHTYKYNEDLFKKVTTLPQGKNHGLVFVLDWSGSMCDILEGTMKQLLSLIMFCDKVNIPFDVYAFSNEWKDLPYTSSEEVTEANVVHIGKEFSMLNILTSKVNRKELGRQMEAMYIIASSYSQRSFDIVPRRMGLSGTPLNEALVLMRSILPEFKEQNGVEKAHVMVLTDGEAAITRSTREVESYDGKTRLTAGRMMYGSSYLRNRQTGTVRKTNNGMGGLTKVLLEDLCTQFPESTFTGFRILESRGGWFIRQATGYDEELQKKWKKDRSIALTNFGYNKYYIVANSSIQQSSEFDVADDASKAKIKTAFVKSLKGKKNNKKILGDFIGLIA